MPDPTNSEAVLASLTDTIRSGDWRRYHSEAAAAVVAKTRQLFQVEHCVLTCSGTAAIELALRAQKIGPGDEVVVAAFDYPGNFRTIEILGATPVLSDVSLARASICPESLQAIASESPPSGRVIKAVVVSHLFGQPAEMGPIKQICKKNGWALIEDACQVPGMMIDGEPAGGIGSLGTLSFGGSKPLTSGHGGAILTNDTKVMARLSGLQSRPSEAFPFSALQAAALLPQLDTLREQVSKRSEAVSAILQIVGESMDTWTPVLAESPPTDLRSHYKMAWLAPDSTSRNDLVHAAEREQLPIGPGFRSLHGASERRCRKPVPLPNSDTLGERCFVLDHRCLLDESGQSRSVEISDRLLRLAAR